jgi:hypothetical protein
VKLVKKRVIKIDEGTDFNLEDATKQIFKRVKALTIPKERKNRYGYIIFMGIFHMKLDDKMVKAIKKFSKTLKALYSVQTLTLLIKLQQFIDNLVQLFNMVCSCITVKSTQSIWQVDNQ